MNADAPSTDSSPGPVQPQARVLSGQYWHAPVGNGRLGYVAILTDTHLLLAAGITLRHFKGFMDAMNQGAPPIQAFEAIPSGTKDIPWERVRSVDYVPRFKELKVSYTPTNGSPDARPKKATFTSEKQETLDLLMGDFAEARPDVPIPARRE